MKKILCPVDFSNASKNGVEFASNLAANLMAHLTLLYVRPSIWPEAVQLKRESEQGAEEITQDLHLMSDQVEKEFGITCGFQVDSTMEVVEKSIARHGDNYDLIVTGTNGADDFFQLVFGSHSFKVIQQAMRPVLLVPEDCSYKPMEQIVYAFDPETNPNFAVEQLGKFAVALGASIKVVHVFESEKSDETENTIALLRKTVMATAHKEIPWTFEGIYGRDVAWTLEHYAASNGVDALALSYHHRTLMDNLFRQNVIKRISMTAVFPIFTFWK